MADGYKPERFFNVRAAVGVSLGTSYTDCELKFVPGVYASAQAAFRLNNSLSLYFEPQAHFYGKHFARLRPSRRQDIIFSTLLGMNYRFRHENGKQRSRRLDPETDGGLMFTSIGVGTGVYGTAMFGKNTKNRPAVVNEIAVGRWMTSVSGVRLAVNNSNMSLGNKPDPHFNFKTLGLEVAYLTNWTALLTGNRDDFFNLNSLVGISMVNGWHKSKHAIAPGGAVGAQANFTLAKKIDLYLEPKVNIYSSKIDGMKTTINVDLDMQLMIGTKYKF